MARSGGIAERSQEQFLADWLDEMNQLGDAERLCELLAHLDTVSTDEPSGHLVRRDGILVYDGPVGEIPDDPVEIARHDRLDDLLR